MSLILYSFIRCPWAMRARLALHYHEIPYELREVNLRDKPAELIAVSPKATVPVLVLADGTVIDESLDIIYWAMPAPNSDDKQLIADLVAENDSFMKHNLSRYKYPDRYPEENVDPIASREQCCIFIAKLEVMLTNNKYLLGDIPSIADFAIFPLIRQFSKVDEDWFNSSEYTAVKSWLSSIYASSYYQAAMQKVPVWTG